MIKLLELVRENQKWVEMARHYKERVAAMLEEEARLNSLSEGVFPQDVELASKGTGAMIACGAYDGWSHEQIRETEESRSKELKVGYRAGHVFDVITFRKRTNYAELRNFMEGLMGINPSLGDCALNTLLYILPAPKCFIGKFDKEAYGIIVSGRTNSHRNGYFAERGLSLARNVFPQLTDRYGAENVGMRFPRQAISPSSFNITQLQKELKKLGVQLPHSL
jgi:hypothetical protein